MHILWLYIIYIYCCIRFYAQIFEYHQCWSATCKCCFKLTVSPRKGDGGDCGFDQENVDLLGVLLGTRHNGDCQLWSCWRVTMDRKNMVVAKSNWDFRWFQLLLLLLFFFFFFFFTVYALDFRQRLGDPLLSVQPIATFFDGLFDGYCIQWPVENGNRTLSAHTE